MRRGRTPSTASTRAGGASRARLAALLAQARRRFRPEQPDEIIPTLGEAHAALSALPDGPYKGEKLAELSEVIAACAGLHLEAGAANHAVAAGAELPLTIGALNRSPAKLELLEVRLPGGPVPVGRPLRFHEPVEIERRLAIPRDAAPSNPYWLAEEPAPGLYTVRDPALIGLPEAPGLMAEFVVRAAGRTLSLPRPIRYQWTDPVMGERHRPVEITPAVMVNPQGPVLPFPDGQPKILRLRLIAGRGGETGALRLALPPGWRAEPAELAYRLGDATR